MDAGVGPLAVGWDLEPVVVGLTVTRRHPYSIRGIEARPAQTPTKVPHRR
jgi:hypothetical protein